MTVCIAAICTWPTGGLMIVGASDRMLSAHDIKFEPPQQKIYQFDKRAIALTAGDPYAQVAIGDEVSRVLQLKPKVTIRELAYLYADAHSAYRRHVAETKFLKPLGLDANSFVDRSQDFRSDLVSDLRLDMQREALDAETIIAGVDETGVHLFVITDPGTVSCADAVGFAAIGSGKGHADSHFMMARHTRMTPSHTAVLNTYIAKRRSEVAPTVGSATDIFFITSDGFWPIAEEIHQKLEEVYADLERKITAATSEADDETTAFIQTYVETQNQSTETTQTTDKQGVKRARGARATKQPRTRRRATQSIA